VNPGHPTYPPVYPPVYPGHPTNPGYPPYYPPTEQMQQFRFESSSFVFGSDARQSLENAAAALQRAGHIVLEKRNNFNSYTLVFRAPSSLKVQKYVSGNFVFGSEAQRAAEEFVLAMQGQGKVVLEKNVSANTFTVSYLTSVHSGYTQQQTYRSGNFVFGSDAARSMTETVTALQGMGAVVLEKRLEATSYTIVYQYSYKLETQNYASGNFIFGSDAARSMTETAEALKRVNGLVVLEKRLAGTSYNIVFFAPYSLQPQKYVSGNYTFGSDAQRAAAETAAALASQGMIILEKNVAGTQFTITYIYGGSQYPY
jgi:glutaredoxin-related protein